ncbi:YdcF family protein [uncultured Tateyamaria sp.]|uniref:YdcF family protein n=1 Tax=uncultured Tateyamaria sp. TaxID=455651 RepID=UPI002632725C|nr:YdcF family protein [uncultured Tateyamaria sp.]
MTDIREAARVLWYFHCVYDDLEPCEVIIGLGSYDLRVAAHCANLFHDGFADHIIFTGARGNWTRELFSASEADAFKDHAIAQGVPSDAISVETHATNIGENIRFCADMVPLAKQAIFVTKPQTQRRCQATVQKQWSNVLARVTAPNTSFEGQPLPHHDERALICEMVGDLDRMQTYATRGFQTEVKVPDAVHRAFDVLVNAGFVDHLQ